jgi:hypothetical protein
MGLFSSGDSGRLAQLFATSDLDEIVWRENVADLVNGVDFVDVVLSTLPTMRDRVTSDVYKVGLTYWPDGPVVRGVQNYTHGQTITFKNVPVKKGATLALAASTSWGESLAARVDVVKAGDGGATARDRQNETPNPLSDLSTAAGLVLGVAALVALAYILSKVD